MNHTLTITAMTCQGCRIAIKNKLKSLEMLQEALIIALIVVLNLYN